MPKQVATATAPAPTASAPAPVAQAPSAETKFAEGVSCPACGATVFDNQGNKRSEKSPDYKCTNKNCGKAGWVRTNGKTGQKFVSWAK